MLILFLIQLQKRSYVLAFYKEFDNEIHAFMNCSHKENAGKEQLYYGFSTSNFFALTTIIVKTLMRLQKTSAGGDEKLLSFCGLKQSAD